MQEKIKKVDKYGGQAHPLKTKAVRLSDFHIRLGTRHGEGIFSDGVRKALEKLDEDSKK